MFIRHRSALSILVLFVLSVFLSQAPVNADDPQDPAVKARPVRPKLANDKPGEQQPTQQSAPATADLTLMQRELEGLAQQIQLLTAEVKRLRRSTERNSDTMELLLLEERLVRVEDKIDLQQDRKTALDAREMDNQSRLRNIQQELLLRGGLRRDETEAAIRADVQRALQDIQNQRTTIQQRLNELQSQASRLRARIEELRKKIEKAEEKTQQ